MPTKVMLTAAGDVCTTYLQSEAGFHQGDENCNGGFLVGGNWELKVSAGAPVTLTASVDKPLPPGSDLVINVSPPGPPRAIPRRFG